MLERVAGATTDIQYIGHQGFTRYAATYWVGANAMLRKRALDSIRVMESERGHLVPRYIQDRTVIEDTESSVDLIERGWTLHNYPERMAWSATPADFGALLIQRRRWANGGLLILPKLLRYLLRGDWRPRKIGEALLRTHYLVSIAAVNLGLLALLAWPFEESARQLWLPATALPYYIAYGRDLVQAGYRFGDLLRVYALNLLLLPVNLGGVLQSLRQALTGSKTPFARTPKVVERTVAPPIYLLSLYGLLALMAVSLVLDVALARWVHFTFILLNGGTLLYAVVRFVGFRASLADIDLQLGARFRRRTPGSDPDA
jgi:cellulose synthase/poly-beta-1,6-N-acetylglucosamine synthase-like glycosyltransferase